MKKFFLKGQGLFYRMDLWFESLFESVEQTKERLHDLSPRQCCMRQPTHHSCHDRGVAWPTVLNLNLSLILAFWRIHIADDPKQCIMVLTKTLTEGKERVINWIQTYSEAANLNRGQWQHRLLSNHDCHISQPCPSPWLLSLGLDLRVTLQQDIIPTPFSFGKVVCIFTCKGWIWFGSARIWLAYPFGSLAPWFKVLISLCRQEGLFFFF